MIKARVFIYRDSEISGLVQVTKQSLIVTRAEAAGHTSDRYTFVVGALM
jgi:hypothetical protein